MNWDCLEQIGRCGFAFSRSQGRREKAGALFQMALESWMPKGAEGMDPSVTALPGRNGNTRPLTGFFKSPTGEGVPGGQLGAWHINTQAASVG